jgi:hypothetical protein
MDPNRTRAGMSDLELEVDLDMEGEAPDEEIGNEEIDDQEVDEEALGDEETGDEELDDEVVQDEYASGDPRDRAYAERFLELSSQTFESEADLDRELHEILRDAERDYFWKKALGRLTKSKVLRGLASKVANRVPGLKALTKLASGDLTGALAAAGQAAIASAVPGGSLLLSELGFEAADEPHRNRAAWHNYAQMTREAYETLADQLHENVDQPLEARRVATRAYAYAVKRATARASARQQRILPQGAVGRRHGRRVVWLEPGQSLVIKTRRR